MIKIKRALLSVSDKTGIVDLAKILKEFDCEIISTGGTRKVLEDAGIKVTEIQSVTGNPEAFGGRMKTISFNIESAILFDRDKDAAEAAKLGIQPIDLVVCNLYPFSRVKESGADFDALIENIDIGGPTMVRAAAKNFIHVAVVTDVNDYQLIMNELKDNEGTLGYDSRFKLMRKAFNHTADYDALISTTMDEQADEKSIRLHFTGGKKLRYGENSHQEGFFYREAGKQNSLYDMNVLHGREISYNNLNDIQGAIDAVKDLSRFAVAVIKHSNPCGLAEADDQLTAMQLAWQGDPVSAFGSIIAFNKPVDLKTVEFFELNNEDKSKRKFVEVVVAPDFSAEALEYLEFHKNLRIVQFDPNQSCSNIDMKYLFNSLLVQDTDTKLHDKMQVVTQRKVNLEKQKKLIEFGITAMRQVKSNSIVIVREKDGAFQLLGMGAGQPNRLISTKLAIEKATENLSFEYNGKEMISYYDEQFGNAILVSDAFFPFPDNVVTASQAGIKTIVQPGGSIRDKKVIKACDDLDIAMIFTGIRHFKH
ncbi:MAG: bifunctional phosphoribosylaminoimidazolecarboxamide formyltransferase/IMP cyclohydrolase [Candidatus Cloacimonetes bacterium]|nr:bifunctional phosphoribosylaminoimidazolecarboxamide formyltransferase/IMP cyclohydrolase [Candidatus Cloacimonadota bacterium]MCF7812877.1 bifunctional phosphoribosylaminoimidazolecarboxamide formyltransferase/IMP cyclohydrolase [Candidatus Cloacimonadota bacterium]MCF7867089.1 bifunctional phosphoribosylaminoimidazolecarboxamide formyltransferase/IMP cyclohydrolase [Candidatus Cloacimonadota bacterium]MCF7882591.1 bifunctional phosphoribosylaminoimidazolecarboxamide formyltransferase/IMP cy